MLNKKIYHYLYSHTEEFIDYWVNEYYSYTEEYQLRKVEKNYLNEYKKESSFLYQTSLDSQYLGTDFRPLLKGVGEDRVAMATPYKEVYFNFFKFDEVMTEFLIKAQKAGEVDLSDSEMIDYMLLQRKYIVKNHYAIFESYFKFTNRVFN